MLDEENNILGMCLKILKINQLKVTDQRKKLLQTLISRRLAHLSIEQISEGIGPYGSHKVTIYRNLEAFLSLGLVECVRLSDIASKFKLTSPEKIREIAKKCSHLSVPNMEQAKEHFHYFRCLDCEELTKIDNCYIKRIETSLAHKGYKNIGHHFELTGFCPGCLPVSFSHQMN